MLSDNAYYEILKKDTPVRGWEHTCHFGIVDSSKEARFVFGGSPDIDASPERYKTLAVPAYRFLQEQIVSSKFLCLFIGITPYKHKGSLGYLYGRILPLSSEI